jgi:hypothetical protein
MVIGARPLVASRILGRLDSIVWVTFKPTNVAMTPGQPHADAATLAAVFMPARTSAWF